MLSAWLYSLAHGPPQNSLVPEPRPLAPRITRVPTCTPKREREREKERDAESGRDGSRRSGRHPRTSRVRGRLAAILVALYRGHRDYQYNLLCPRSLHPQCVYTPNEKERKRHETAREKRMRETIASDLCQRLSNIPSNSCIRTLLHRRFDIPIVYSSGPTNHPLPTSPPQSHRHGDLCEITPILVNVRPLFQTLYVYLIQPPDQIVKR